MTWRLPAGYTAAQLVEAMKHARLHPEDTYITPGGEQMSAEGYRSWFRRRLAAKINRLQARRGRKDHPDWYWWAWRTSRAVNTPRLIVRPPEVPLELRRRLAHRLFEQEAW